MNLYKQTKRKTITTGGFVQLFVNFPFGSRPDLQRGKYNKFLKKPNQQAEVFEDRVQMKVQHEMRSQQPLSTSLRIIQWHLFISTRAAQTEKVKSVLALTGRTRVRISWQRPTRCQYHVLLPLSALTHVSP